MRHLNAAVKPPALCRLALSSLFLLSLGACSKKDELVIYATARSGGSLWTAPGRENGAGGNTGGYAVLKNAYAREKGPKLAVDLGNWLGETPEGYLTKGLAVAACMNAVPYDAAALGPEDLSLSPSDLEKFVRASSAPVLASNLYLRGNKKPSFLESSRILELDGKKIGFLAVTVMDPERFGVQRFLPNYKFEKESYEIERAMKTLKDGGADLTVLLLGINPRKKAEKDFYASFFRKLPPPSLVITDDPGLKKPLRLKRTWVVAAPHGLEAAARIELSLDGGTGRLDGVKAENLALNREEYGEDPSVLEIMKEQRSAISRIFSKRIGSVSSAIPRNEGRASPLGNFTADCMKRWARTDAAVLNNSVLGGGLTEGPVTLGDLYRVMPLDTSVVFVKIRGEDLKSAIETISGDISVSGMEISMRGKAVEKLVIEGRPARPERIYRIAVPDAIVNGRNYSLLANATEFANSRHLLRKVLGWCFSRRTVTPKPDLDRITRAEGSVK